MDLRARQQTNRGYDDAMSRSFELALTPAVFGVIGWLIDRSAGTSPTFTIMLAVFGVVGTVAKFWLDYDRQMKRHEAEGIWSRKSGASNTGEQQ
ncbi:MAG: AtpZ/AtpI family protein [Acidimicrobiales bacterium]|nr:AtpZ/AtpI family protein [Acidimicrobiales bacterium]